MHTPTSVGMLACVIGVTLIDPDAAALWQTVNDGADSAQRHEHTDLPPNIQVSPDLQRVVAIMLRDSRTFRRQCGLLGGRQRLQVQIALEAHPGWDRAAARARADLAPYEFGRITARVRVWSRADAIELIAHELEHVIEFVDGTNYRALALLQPGSVWAGDRGAFETMRATLAGAEVKREVSQANATLDRHR
jgi:hypothetical protein